MSVDPESLSAWEPILTTHAEAERVLGAIIDDLSAIDLTRRSVFELCDTGLLFVYAHKLNSTMASRDVVKRCVAQVVRQCRQAPPSAGSLYRGLAAVGWFLEHTRPTWQDADLSSCSSEDVRAINATEDLLNDIDHALLVALEQTTWAGSYDLVSGLAGLGVYFLERAPRKRSHEALKRITEHLVGLAHVDDDGVTWRTPRREFPTNLRATDAEYCFNFGVAHGIPCIIALLTEVVHFGIQPGRTDSLLEASVTWLMAKQNHSNSDWRFPYWIAPGVPLDAPRLAWCYGDLGIAGVLQHVGYRLNRPHWQTFADDLFDTCLKPDRVRQRVADASICHGAAGIGHIFNRAFQRSRKEQYVEAARLWYRRTLDFQSNEPGVFRSKKDDPPRMVQDRTFLQGNVGVALALTAAMGAHDPAWDRLLMLSTAAR